VENAGLSPASRGSLAGVALSRHGVSPGLREVAILWGVYLIVAAEVFATYARLPARELYHVSHNGRVAGAGRVVVFLNWPVALAAIPMLAVVATVARSRRVSRLAVVAALLCGAIFWPGMVDQTNLDAKWPNAIAAVGVLLALTLTVVVLLRCGLGTRTRARGDRLRLGIGAVLALLALPWLAADLGFLVGHWPLFGSVYYSDEWYAPFGHARAHRAVHTGNHHGLVGVLLVVTVLLLSRTLPALGRRLRPFVGAYLAVLLFYALALIANDFWLEQVVKRGVTHWEFPSLITPTPTLGWLILLLLAALVYVLVLRRLTPGRTFGGGTPVWPAVAALAIVTLVSVGLAHGGTSHSTPVGTADGIVFAAAPAGKSHLYETRGGRVVQLTSADGSDLAPAWSSDHRRIAFQSNRDGNWELYVMNADGSGTRRLTHDAARDGEPGWSPDGTKIAFTRNGDLYEVGADGRHVQSLENPGEWPTWSTRADELAADVPYGDHYYGLVANAPGKGLTSVGPADNRRPSWSPDGRLIAFECRFGGHWHVCVMNRSGRTQRHLTPDSSDAFAPAWSPDGRRIAFVSDRDGVDQLFVMRADGTHVVRLTSGPGEKDTPTWARR
jgi:Tol biopolymer transport system component